MIKVYYLDLGNEHYRVRRSDWASDAFETVGHDRLLEIGSVCDQLGIPFQSQPEED